MKVLYDLFASTFYVLCIMVFTGASLVIAKAIFSKRKHQGGIDE